MKFGLIPVNVGVKSVEQIVGLAQLAESVGVESVWTFEHVIVPEDYSSKYPYSADGKMAARPNTNFVDPLIALTAVAAHTRTLRIGTGVNIVSQANPLLLAKQAASLDFVSGGRFMLGAGIGWLREEFDAMGVPFERRGARLDDYLVAMKKVWSGEVVEHHSEFIDWSGFRSYPVPAKPGGVPIIIGGIKGKIYQRVARFGDGWFLPVDTPAALADKLAPLPAACEAVGRDPASVEISCMWNMQGGLDAIRAFEAAGAARIIIPVPGLGKDPVAGLMQLAETIIAKC
jgi:probable F420-dependent oxidoreductase